jgi:hypothetical protein
MSNDITDHTRGRGILQEAAEGNKARHEQLVSMISDIDWRYRVNAQAEHVGSYISLVADRMLGLPDCTIGKALRQILFPLSHPDDLSGRAGDTFRSCTNA